MLFSSLWAKLWTHHFSFNNPLACLPCSLYSHVLTWASLCFHRCVLLQLPLHWQQMVGVHRTGAHKLDKAGSKSLSLYKSDPSCLAWHSQICSYTLSHFPAEVHSPWWLHLVLLVESHIKCVHSVESQSSIGHWLHRWFQKAPGDGSPWSTESWLSFHNQNQFHW